MCFFDYMDVSFTYPNYWIQNYLNDKTNSFLLIMEKSRLYKNRYKEIINKMMKTFEEKIYKGSLSKIKILDINPCNEGFDLENIFSEIFSFLNGILQTTRIFQDLSLMF